MVKPLDNNPKTVSSYTLIYTPTWQRERGREREMKICKREERMREKERDVKSQRVHAIKEAKKMERNEK